MNIVIIPAAFVSLLLCVLFLASRVGSFVIERRNPPVGAFASVGDAGIHHVHLAAGPRGDLPPVVFIHGASSNLRDQMLPLRPVLEGRGDLLFVDRPGHGWSERGSGNETPFGQAASIAALMDRIGIERAVVVGHSFGGAIAAALALAHPQKVSGLVFLSAASHPWPGGATSWYYSLAAAPLVGRLFSETLALPGGAIRIGAASACVFAPNRLPERYVRDASIELVLRPAAFRANAVDVAGLYRHVTEAAPRYRGISAPTVVVSGNRDTVVYEEIHSLGLVRDIPGAELVWVDNLGHKPEWIAPELVVAAIERVSGGAVDIQQVARGVEARIAGDAYGSEDCREPDMPAAVPGRP